MPDPLKKPAPSGRKRYIALAVLALAILAAVAFFFSARFAERKAWEGFSLAMDRAAGEGAWFAEGHSFSFLGRILTVQGLSLDFPPPGEAPSPAASAAAAFALPVPPPPAPIARDEPAQAAPAEGTPPAGEGPDTAGTAPPGGDPPDGLPAASAGADAASPALRDGTVVRVATVRIQGSPDRKLLERLTADGPLPAGPGGKLFALASIDGLEGAKTVEGHTTRYGFGKLEFTDLALKPAETDGPAGSASLAKSLTAGRIELTGYRTGFASPTPTGETFSLALDRILAAAPELGDGFTDPGNFVDILRNLSFAEFRAEGFRTAVHANGLRAFAAEAGEVAVAGYSAGGKADSVSGRGLVVAMKDPSVPEFTAYLTLDSFAAALPDLTVPLARAADVTDRLATDFYFPSLGRIWEEFPRVSDLVSPPFGIERGTLSGLAAEVRPGPSLRITEAAVTGPFQAQAPPSGTVELKSVVFTPPDDPRSILGDNLRTVALLLPFLGQETLELNLRAQLSSDPPAGGYRFTLHELSAKGAGELTGSISIEGLRTELLAPLSRVLLSDLWRLSMGGDLSGVALQRVQLNYSDKGLFPAFYSLLAEEAGREAPEARDALTAFVRQWTQERLGDELTDLEPLNAAISTYLSAPGTFSVSAAPDPPFSHAVYETLPMVPGAVRNALNITVSVNGEPSVPLRFGPSSAPGDAGDGDEDSGDGVPDE
ncbi:MAG: hypothetical protein LBG06_08600 [Deltaproteobacteria bacterium]|jgi:hypothetical protein|nr:hypothetical protein [Deltaproteobacteria bacterium]